MLVRFAASKAAAVSSRYVRPSAVAGAVRRGGFVAARSSSSSSSQVQQHPIRCFSTQVTESHESESFLTGTSSLYAEQMYEQYLQDPNSVHVSWKRYFDDLQGGVPYDEMSYNKPTAAASSVQRVITSVRLFFCYSEIIFQCLSFLFTSYHG